MVKVVEVVSLAVVVEESDTVPEVSVVVPLASQKPHVVSQRWACAPHVGQKITSQSETIREQVTRQSGSL